MSVQDAAVELYENLGPKPWLTNIGIGSKDGEDCIYIYVKRIPRKERGVIPKKWQGFYVMVKNIGDIMPF